MTKWERLSDEALLTKRFCDLTVDFKESPVYPLVQRLRGELNARSLRVRPHFWFSNEWFTPEGFLGIAVPFYLAHPRLKELDDRQMRGLLAESPERTLKILRHEAGHVVQNAFGLCENEQVQSVFGRSDTRYPKYYSPQPYSRRFVRHLGDGYAQSHPDEDFAETFAVWLTPRSQWRRRYRGWPALDKLEFMDRLMRSLAGKVPTHGKRRPFEPIHQLDQTLAAHYQKNRRHFRLEAPEIDRPLLRVFSEKAPSRSSMTAPRFLRKIRPKLVRKVADMSGEPAHRVNRVVQDFITRSERLKLQAGRIPGPSENGIPLLLTRHALRCVKAGWYQIAI